MSTRRALAFSFLDRYSGLLIAIATSAIIARLLTPKELGTFSITMVVLSFAGAIRDMGAGQYIVQEKEITQERLRAAWTVLLVVGFSLALVVLAIAYPVAALYREPKIAHIMLLLALNFALTPFGSMTYAWLMREMSFGKLAVMRFVSTLVGSIVSVVLAMRGHGAMSLAYGSVTTTVTNALCAMAFRPISFPWLPGGLGQVRKVLGFGSKISLTTLTNNFAFSSPELFLGKLQNLADVGLFSRANGLATMFNKLVMDATNSVVLSAFARDARQGGAVRENFLRANLYVTATAWSFFGFTALHADALLLLLYGPQWHGAILPTRLLAIGMSFGVTASLLPPTLTALGRPDLVMRCAMVAGSIYAATMAIGAYLGLIAMSCCFIIANLLGALSWIYQAQPALELGLRRYVLAMRPSLLLAAATTLPSVALKLLPNTLLPPMVAMFVCVPLGALAFAWTARRLAHPIHQEIDRMMNLLRRRSRPTGP